MVREITIRLGQAYDSTIKDILVWHEDTRRKRLEEYYFDTDMEQAERYWKEKEYIKAKELYLKNKDKLSDTQMKKLNYITIKKMD